MASHSPSSVIDGITRFTVRLLVPLSEKSENTIDPCSVNLA